MAIDSTRRTWRSFAGRLGTLLGAAVLVAGCQNTPASSAGASQPSPTGDPSSPPTSAASPAGSPGAGGTLGDTGWIFDAGARPIDLAVTLDEARKVEQVVPIDGGTVSATGADGTVYTLAIPRDSLLAETSIGLTPVASLTGLPFGGDPTYAVQLSPDGLFLYSPAILTITPAQPIPAAEQLTFGYLADGRDVVLAEPVLGTAEIAIRVDHFSGSGVTKGPWGDIEPDRRRIGGNAERRLSDALSGELIRIKQEGGDQQAVDVGAAYEAALLELERQVVQPRVAAAGESCAKARLAIESILGLERKRQLTGASGGGDPLAAYPGLVAAATRKCVVEQFELCVEDHDILDMSRVEGHFRRQFALMGTEVDESAMAEARELTRTCLTFTLKIESTGNLDVPNGGYTSKVQAEIVLHVDMDDGTLSGDGPLRNTSFEFRAPCGATGVTGDGTVDIRILRILTAKGDQFNSDEINFQMNYLFGPTSESARIKACPPARGEAIMPQFGAWNTIFMATHILELDATGQLGGGYVAIDWEMLGGELFARKEWIREAAGGGGQITEAGTFKLYHTPGA